MEKLMYNGGFLTLYPEKTDPFDVWTEILKNRSIYEGESNLPLINKIFALSLATFALTASLAAAQQKYFPLHQTVEAGIAFLAFIPLPIAIIAEGGREFEAMRIEVLGM